MEDRKPENLPIMVGMDGSKPSKTALRWALDQAELTGQRVAVIATWELPTNYGWEVPWPTASDIEPDLRKSMEATIKEVAGDDGPDRPEVTLTIAQGHPAPMLVEKSKEASLMVVGSRGHGAFAGLMLGSVSEFLASHAHCPVVIVKEGQCDPDGSVEIGAS